MARRRTISRRGDVRRGGRTWLLCILIAACSQDAPRPDGQQEAARPAAAPAEHAASSPRPDVILITIDTLRADRLGCYGYSRDTSPFLDSLAGEGVVFERAYAPSPWTAPSMVSLFSSRHPVSHGVTQGGIEKIEGAPPHQEAWRSHRVILQQVIPERVALWPEILKRAGYRTFASVTNMHLDRDLGFARGFDRFHNAKWKDASVVRQEAARWRDELREPGPSFLWVHVFDPHAPYYPRDPWIREYHPAYPETPGLPAPLNKPEELVDRVLPGSPQLAFMNALYDSEIAYADAQLSRLLEEVGADDDDLVVVTSDHGEEFREHGGFGHAHSLHDELLRVPLIVRLPGGRHAGLRVRDRVSLIDVLPSVLDLLDLEIPGGLEGRSFLPLVEGGALPPRPVHAHLDRIHRLSAVIDGEWKYVHAFETGDHLLFNLRADPAETENRIGASSEIARLLQERLLLLEELLGRDSAAPGLHGLSEKEQEELRALGYVN